MKAITLVLIIVSSIAFADPLTVNDRIPLTYGQSTVVCPTAVVCDSEDPKSCHLSDNPYDLWDKPKLLSATTVIKGTYPLGFISANNTKDDMNHLKKEVSCQYFNGRWETYRNFLVKLKYADSNIFNKLKKESSEWSDDGYCYPKTTTPNSPLDPILCPLTQSSGISVFDDTTIKLFYHNPNAYFEPNFIASKWLSYDQLYAACGATSTCIIDIGQCDNENENCSSYGSAYLDISIKNVVKLTQLNSYKVPENPYVFKQKQPFNMIYSEPSKH